jgi:sterol desaturase/sphingolipid hydroxylase (fatty acid hydroxylase superfamily)
LVAALIAGIIVGATYIGLAFAVLLPLELMAPRGRVSWRSRWRAFVLWMLVFTPTGAAFSLIVDPRFKPLVWPGVWVHHPILAVVLAVVVYDFGFYAMHRIQHRFFWRWHAVHHAIEDVSIVNSYNHPVEHVFEWSAMILPLILVGLAPTLITRWLFSVQALYVHSASRINAGPLRWIVNDNRFHRIHHSREPEHFDRNFGLFFPFWDVVLGTAHMHEPEAWPSTGVEGVPPARDWLDYLVHPLRRR